MAKKGKKVKQIVRPPDWPHHGAAQDVVKTLEETYHYGLGGYRTFEKFVELCNLALDGLPNFVHQLSTGVLPDVVRDTPELFEKWQQATADQRPEVINIYARAFALLLEATMDWDGQLSYADVIGTAFEFFGVSKSAQQYAGIFFTPFNVAYMMATMVIGDIKEELKRRFVQALEHESVKSLATVLSLGLLAAEALDAKDYGIDLLAKLIPLAKSSPACEPIRICDPCVGSGVMLLAAAKALPRYAIDLGLVEFYGADINYLCVEMCRLNLRLYGIIPTGVSVPDLITCAHRCLPAPYPELYDNALTDADPGREYWIEQVRTAGAIQIPMWTEEEVTA